MPLADTMGRATKNRSMTASERYSIAGVIRPPFPVSAINIAVPPSRPGNTRLGPKNKNSVVEPRWLKGQPRKLVLNAARPLGCFGVEPNSNGMTPGMVRPVESNECRQAYAGRDRQHGSRKLCHVGLVMVMENRQLQQLRMRFGAAIGRER